MRFIIKSLYKNQEGQSLLELIIALLILVAALVASIVLIVTSINAGRDSRNRLIATSLAREGIEIVRNIRDSNWIDQREHCKDAACINEADCIGAVCSSTWGLSDWDEGLNPGILVVSNNMTAIPRLVSGFATELDFSISDFSDPLTRIRKSGNEYVQGSPISPTDTYPDFFRLLTLEAICRDAVGSESFAGDNTNANDCGADEEVGVRVISEVRWPSNTSNKKVIIEDRLYNWQTL